MTLSAKTLNARNVVGIAVLTLMIGMAAWATRHLMHQSDQSQKVGVVVVEDL